MTKRINGFVLSIFSGAMGLVGMTSYAAPAVGDRAPAVDMRYPENALIQHGGPVYDVARPPSPELRPALGDGQTDDTEALRDALDYLRDRHLAAIQEGQTQNLHVYLPDGIYLVSDTVFWRGETAGNEVSVRIIGQSREGVVLRLQDRAAGFDDPDRPKAVLGPQRYGTTGHGGIGDYALRNVTIDTGRNNPGAVGLLFQGANRTDLRNVRILSGDGQGKTGLWLPEPSPVGCGWDVLIEGFDYGIHVPRAEPFAEINVAFAHLTLKNQRKAGLLSEHGGVELLNILSDQTDTGVIGLHLRRPGLQCVVLSSVFLAGDQADAAIRLEEEDNQCLLARKVTTGGYARSIVQPGRNDLPGGEIKEYLNYPAATLFTDRAITLSLPVRSAPTVPTFDPESEWADVTAYGASGDDASDDTEAINAALSSGKPVVYFPSHVYRVDGTLRIPAGVRRIEFLGARIKGGHLLVGEATSQPLLVTDSGDTIRVDVEQPRPIVFRRNRGTVGNLQDRPLDVFIENSTHVGGNLNFCTKNQSVWGFGMRNEGGTGANFVCNGGALWMMNFRTGRQPHPSFLVRNGGFLEALGGCAGADEATGQTPLIVNDHSSAAVTLYTSGRSPLGTIIETQNGEMKYLHWDRQPRRFGADSNLPGVEDMLFLPLYVGDALGSPHRPNWRAEE